MRDPTRPFGLADVDQAYNSLDSAGTPNEISLIAQIADGHRASAARRRWRQS